MAQFKDLDEFFDPGLQLTIGGKVYTVDPPSAELGLWCERVMTASASVGTAKTEAEVAAAAAQLDKVPNLPGDMSLPERVLGDAYAKMVADSVPWPKIKVAGSTAFLWIVLGEEAAAAFWQSGGRPEAAAPNRASRRATSNSTGAAKGTRQRGSTSGTNSPKTSSRAKANRSTGRTS